MDKWTNSAILGLLTHFRASKNFPKKFGSVRFKYLWSLIFMQKIKKTQAQIHRTLVKCGSNNGNKVTLNLSSDVIGDSSTFFVNIRHRPNILD